MAAFVAALDHDPSVRRRWLWVGAGTVGLATVAVLLGVRGARRPLPPSSPPPLAVASAPAPVTADARTLTQLTPLEGCAYSPTFVDARTIVFDQSVQDRDELYVVSPDGGEPRRIPGGQNAEWRAAPGPGPGQAVFTSPHREQRRLAVSARASPPARRTPLGVESPFPSYGGGALYYATGDMLQVRRRDGQNDAKLVSAPAGNRVSAVIAAPPDKVAVIVRSLNTSPQLCPVVGGELACTKPAGLIHGRPAFGPDGALYYGTRSGIFRVGQDEPVVSRPGSVRRPHGVPGRRQAGGASSCARATPGCTTSPPARPSSSSTSPSCTGSWPGRTASSPSIGATRSWWSSTAASRARSWTRRMARPRSSSSARAATRWSSR